MLTLYHNHSSVCASKVRFAMEEKRLTWEPKFIDIFKGEAQSPDYLKLNPMGVVPTLLHDGFVLIESTLINEYIDDQFRETSLKPTGARPRYRMRLWTKRLDDSIHNAAGIVSHAVAFRHLQLKKPKEEIEAALAKMPDQARAARNRDLIFNGIDSAYFADALTIIRAMLADMETALHETPWLAGNTLSLADIGLAPYIHRLDGLGFDGLWADKPKLADWYIRIQARPAFRVGIVKWTGQAPYIELMREKGEEVWPRIRDLAA